MFLFEQKQDFYNIMKGKENCMNEKTKEFRKSIAEAFIKSLEEKQLDWKKEWNGPSIHPVNAINNKRYKSINKFWLSMIAIERGTEDPRWCTFKQIQDKGWKLNKGSKGVKIEYWLPYDKKEKKGISWDDYRRRSGEPSVILVTRYYVVFNGKDIEGIPPLPPLQVNNINPDELIARLSKNMAVEILNDGRDRAFYNTLEDKIHMPMAEHFKSDYAYNATALHELAHSSGAAHRLNRDLNNMFGSSSYAYEELIAEISSCFMSASLRIKQDKAHVDNHKAYVQSWIKAIKEKPETLIKAIREAEKAANYMEYKAELINEKDYRYTLNESLEVNVKDVQENYKVHNPSISQKAENKSTVLFKDNASGLEAGINADGELYFGNDTSGYNLRDTVENRRYIERDIARYTGQKIDLFVEFIAHEDNLKQNNNNHINENSDNIKIEGHIGTWYVIESEMIAGKSLFLLESEQYGDEAASLIVDGMRNIILEDVYNGFDDYREKLLLENNILSFDKDQSMRKSIKDVQNTINDYKKNTSYNETVVSTNKNYIEQR